MAIYHVETREDYDDLMSELDSKGYKWLNGQYIESFDGFHNYKGNTVIKKYSDKLVAYGEIGQILTEQIIEYKARRNNVKHRM